MVTWRCAVYDLAGQGGTLPLTGMDAGCTPTLVPASGLLNIPNFGTHHKRNRMTAMALVHVSENGRGPGTTCRSRRTRPPRRSRRPASTSAAPATAAPVLFGGRIIYVAGLRDGGLVEGLLASSNLSVLAFDSDAATVEKVRRRLDDRAKPLCWSAVRIMGNILVGTVFSPQDLVDAGADCNGGEWSGDRMPMARLLAIDRSTGKLLWSRKANWGFLNRGGVATRSSGKTARG